MVLYFASLSFRASLVSLSSRSSVVDKFFDDLHAIDIGEEVRRKQAGEEEAGKEHRPRLKPSRVFRGARKKPPVSGNVEAPGVDQSCVKARQRRAVVEEKPIRCGGAFVVEGHVGSVLPEPGQRRLHHVADSEDSEDKTGESASSPLDGADGRTFLVDRDEYEEAEPIAPLPHEPDAGGGDHLSRVARLPQRFISGRLRGEVEAESTFVPLVGLRIIDGKVFAFDALIENLGPFAVLGEPEADKVAVSRLFLVPGALGAGHSRYPLQSLDARVAFEKRGAVKSLNCSRVTLGDAA